MAGQEKEGPVLSARTDSRIPKQISLQAPADHQDLRDCKTGSEGCRPWSPAGGWLQIARETVGPEGLVLGIDIKEIQPLHSPNVKLLKMDVYADDVPDRIIAELGGPANTVLSDLAPSIIGACDVDHARQVELARRALAIGE